MDPTHSKGMWQSAWLFVFAVAGTAKDPTVLLNDLALIHLPF